MHGRIFFIWSSSGAAGSNDDNCVIAEASLFVVEKTACKQTRKVYKGDSVTVMFLPLD